MVEGEACADKGRKMKFSLGKALYLREFSAYDIAHSVLDAQAHRAEPDHLSRDIIGQSLAGTDDRTNVLT